MSFFSDKQSYSIESVYLFGFVIEHIILNVFSEYDVGIKSHCIPLDAWNISYYIKMSYKTNPSATYFCIFIFSAALIWRE